jgi:acyl-CoA synthetase (NDP forming)
MPREHMSRAIEIIEKARNEGRAILTEFESKQLLASLGIPTTRMVPAASREEAVAVSREVGYPCVLKVSSADITHKSDAGGV